MIGQNQTNISAIGLVLNSYNAEVLLYTTETRFFFKIKIIITVLVLFSSFEYLCYYAHYKLLLFQCEIRRQILTSNVNPRTERVKQHWLND